MRRRKFLSTMSAIGLWPIYRIDSQRQPEPAHYVDRHRIARLKSGECGFIDNFLFCLADDGFDKCLWFNPSGKTAVYEEPCTEANVFLNGNTLMARTTLVWRRGDEYWFRLPSELEEFYRERRPFVNSVRRLYDCDALRLDRKRGEYHVASVPCELSRVNNVPSQIRAELEYCRT